VEMVYKDIDAQNRKHYFPFMAYVYVVNGVIMDYKTYQDPEYLEAGLDFPISCSALSTMKAARFREIILEMNSQGIPIYSKGVHLERFFLEGTILTGPVNPKLGKVAACIHMADGVIFFTHDTKMKVKLSDFVCRKIEDLSFYKKWFSEDQKLSIFEVGYTKRGWHNPLHEVLCFTLHHLVNYWTTIYTVMSPSVEISDSVRIVVKYKGTNRMYMSVDGSAQILLGGPMIKGRSPVNTAIHYLAVHSIPISGLAFRGEFHARGVRVHMFECTTENPQKLRPYDERFIPLWVQIMLDQLEALRQKT
jgi:hypothetical protein